MVMLSFCTAGKPNFSKQESKDLENDAENRLIEETRKRAQRYLKEELVKAQARGMQKRDSFLLQQQDVVASFSNETKEIKKYSEKFEVRNNQLSLI